jgi:hypothetical protein
MQTHTCIRGGTCSCWRRAQALSQGCTSAPQKHKRKAAASPAPPCSSWRRLTALASAARCQKGLRRCPQRSGGPHHAHQRVCCAHALSPPTPGVPHRLACPRPAHSTTTGPLTRRSHRQHLGGAAGAWRPGTRSCLHDGSMTGHCVGAMDGSSITCRSARGANRHPRNFWAGFITARSSLHTGRRRPAPVASPGDGQHMTTTASSKAASFSMGWFRSRNRLTGGWPHGRSCCREGSESRMIGKLSAAAVRAPPRRAAAPQ